VLSCHVNSRTSAGIGYSMNRTVFAREHLRGVWNVDLRKGGYSLLQEFTLFSPIDSWKDLSGGRLIETGCYRLRPNPPQSAGPSREKDGKYALSQRPTNFSRLLPTIRPSRERDSRYSTQGSINLTRLLPSSPTFVQVHLSP
jgi:hypothetical protein